MIEEIRPLLLQLREAALKIASPETASNPGLYAKEKLLGILKSPLTGHCVPISFLVKSLFGGHLVWNYIQTETHYWNLLPSGEEVDLTSCQFGGDGMTPLNCGIKVNRFVDFIPPAYLFYAQLIENQLNYNRLDNQLLERIA